VIDSSIQEERALAAFWSDICTQSMAHYELVAEFRQNVVRFAMDREEAVWDAVCIISERFGDVLLEEVTFWRPGWEQFVEDVVRALDKESNAIAVRFGEQALSQILVR